MTPISERLRAKRLAKVQPRMPDDDPYYEPVNPDGPEAADIIDALLEALEAVAPYLNTMLVDDDPDDETIGWEADGDGGHTKPIDFTMGQIRKVNAAIARARGAA